MRLVAERRSRTASSRRRGYSRKPTAVLLTLLVAGAVVSAAYASGSASTRATKVPHALIKKLPTKLKALYAGSQDPIGRSRYGHFGPVKKRWKMCLADSYEGNSWRLDVRQNLALLTRDFAKKHMTDARLTVTNSNGNVALENSQVRQLVNQGCSAIITIPGSATGANAAYAYAYKKGVAVVTLDGSVTSPYVINVNSNYFLWGAQMAQQIVKYLNGTGNVIMVEGIAGQPLTAVEDAGAKSVFKKHPGIKVVAEVNGDWTGAPTKTAVLQALASHPEKIDAVWSTGGQQIDIAKTFQQVGRPVPVVTGSPGADSLSYNHANPHVVFVGGDLAPTWTAQAGFRVAVRLLEGQHPRLNTIYVPIPSRGARKLKKLYQSCMTQNAETPWPVESKDPLPVKLMNKYFVNGKAIPPYNYAKMSPSPCK